MASLLLAVKHAQQELEFARQRIRIVQETSVEPAKVAKGATAGGDSRKLRGIPAIGRGVRGAIADTVPHDVE